MSAQRGESLGDSDYFAGRGDELAVLRNLLTGLAAGVGGAVLVEGEQGIGKSALLRQVLADAGGTAFRLAWATSDELHQRIPLLLIRDCLGGVRLVRSGARGAAPDPGAPGDERAAGPVVASPVPSGDPVLAETERLLAEVERLCTESPVMLVTEDLQWADEASLLVWQRLAQAAGQLPLLLAGTYRLEPAREQVTMLRGKVVASGGTVLSLGPLPTGHLQGLVEHVTGARPGPRLAEEVRAAGGNPLYVRELVDALVREGKVAVDAGVAELAAEPRPMRVPALLRVMIAERLSALPEETVTALRWATVLGPEFRVIDLQMLTGRSIADLANVLEPAFAGGVVAEAGGKLAFRHALIRRQLYEGIPPARSLHAQAARALAEAGAPEDQIAAQLALAPGQAADWVPEWLASALPVLAYRMPQATGELLRDVIAALPDNDSRREPLQAGLVTVAFLLGQYDEVQQAGRRMLAGRGSPDRAAEVTWLMAYSMLRAGHPAEAIDALKIAVTRPGVSEVWSARLHALLALMLTMTRRLDEAAEAAARALTGAQRTADPFATGYVLHAQSAASFFSRDLATALNRIDQALTVIGHRNQATDLRLMLLANRVGALGLLDRHDEAISAARQALIVAERAGTSRVAVLHCTLAHQHFEAGHWDDALAELDPALDSDLGAGSSLAHGLIALIAGYRDAGDLAREHLDAVSEHGSRAAAAAGNSHYLHLARAVAAERAGRPKDAVAVLAACLTPGAARSMPARHLLLPVLVRLALAVGDADTAAAATRAAADEAEREPVPVKGAVADHCRGLLTADLAPVLAAAAYHGSAGRPLRRAEALTDAAALLAAQGGTAPASEWFDEAVALYRGMGARWAIRGGSARLREFGGVVSPGEPSGGFGGAVSPGKPSGGFGGVVPPGKHGVVRESLTSTEAKIAGLIAGGRSNPQIGAELSLSSATVRAHVSRILEKLGARSRMELVASVVWGKGVPLT